MTAPPMAADHAHARRITERTRSARLIRDSIGLLSSKWSVDVLLALGDGTRRYHELLEDLAPISEKVLTQTLRAMERDGLLRAPRPRRGAAARGVRAVAAWAPRWRRR